MNNNNFKYLFESLQKVDDLEQLKTFVKEYRNELEGLFLILQSLKLTSQDNQQSYLEYLEFLLNSHYDPEMITIKKSLRRKLSASFSILAEFAHVDDHDFEKAINYYRHAIIILDSMNNSK